MRSAVLLQKYGAIGMFNRASLISELRHPDIMTILDKFIVEAWDISLVWPRRRFS